MENFNFESSLSELEKIVAQLENGDATLDESLELFSKGVELTKQCNAFLSDAKLKITELNSLKEAQ